MQSSQSNERELADPFIGLNFHLFSQWFSLFSPISPISPMRISVAEKTAAHISPSHDGKHRMCAEATKLMGLIGLIGLEQQYQQLMSVEHWTGPLD